MTIDQQILLAAASVTTLATAWAAWVSKTLVAILTVMQGTEQRVDTLESSVADHETRIRGLEST